MFSYPRTSPKSTVELISFLGRSRMRVISASVVLVAAVGLAALGVEAQSTQSQRRFVQQGGITSGFNQGHGGFGTQGFGPAPQRDFGPQKFVKDPRTGQYVPVQKTSSIVHPPHHSGGHIHGSIPAVGLQQAFQVAQQQQLLQQQQQQQFQQQQIQHQQQQQQFQQQQQQIQQQQIHQQQQQQQQQFPDVSAFARFHVGQGQADLPYQECLTPGNEEGRCHHLMHCIRPEITANSQIFLQYACVIQDTYIGVCCTSSSRTANVEPQVEPQPDPEPSKPAATTPPFPNQPQPQPIPTQPIPTQPQRPPTTQIQSTQQSTINQSPSTLTSELQRKLTGPLECGRVSETINTRIVGGIGSHPGEYPWIVAVMRREAVPNNYCGGCLISPQHVLTAAHCIVGFDQRDIWVRVGEHNFNRTDESPHANHRVLNFFPHPGFQQRTFENDFALLTLARPVQLGGFITPICLPEDGESLSGLMITVAGWGAIRYDGPVSPILRQVKLPVWTNSDCDRAYSQPIRDNMVCAGFPEGGKDACQDDSGGPMMHIGQSGRWQVDGLVSFGTKCAEPGKPGVYSRVAKFLPWLSQHL